MLIANEPHLTGAHPPDAVLLAPAFAGDLLVGFCGMRAHMGDLGGRSTCPIDAKTMWEEGLQLPPSLLIAAGKPNEVLLGGRRSELAAAARGDRQPPLRRGGDDAERRARSARSSIATASLPTAPPSTSCSMPPSTRPGSCSRRFPTASTAPRRWSSCRTAPARSRSSAWCAVEGSDVTVDVTGSAPEQPCSLNVPLPQTIAACRLALKRLTTQDTMTANSGEHRMLTVIAPEGCIFNAQPPAGCYMMANTASLLGEMIVNLISAAMPSRQMAESGGNTTGFLGWMHERPARQADGGRRSRCDRLRRNARARTA